MQYVFMDFLCMLLNINYMWKQLVVFIVHHYTWLSLAKDVVRFISCFSEELKRSDSVNYFESFFIFESESCGTCHLWSTLATRIHVQLVFFFCLPVLFCYRRIKGVYWVRCLVGGYLYVCCKFGVIHVHEMTCRDASVGSGVGKGMKGWVGSMSDSTGCLPLLLLKSILEIHVEKGI